MNDRHFADGVFDTGAYRSMREYEKARGPWLEANPGKDQDDYHEWYMTQENHQEQQ